MAQRVTNSMMIMNFNSNLNRANTSMNRYQSQLATNRRIVRLSDDPVGVIKSVNARGKLADIEQFKSNISYARSWLTASETALNEINEIVKRVNELAVQASTGTLDYESRKAISYEISQLRDQMITVGNTTMGDKFIFGGYNVTKAPFDGNPDTGEILFNNINMITDSITEEDNAAVDFEIGVSNMFTVGMEGANMMGIGSDKNLYYQFTLFDKALNDPATTEEDMRVFIDKMQELQTDILSQMSDIGGRINRLDMISDRYDQDEINYTQMQSDVEDLDQAEAIMWFSMQEAVYRAALNVGGRILQPTLMDFLK